MIATPVQTWRTKALYGALPSAPYSANGALVAYYLVRLRAPYSANVPSRVCARARVNPSNASAGSRGHGQQAETRGGHRLRFLGSFRLGGPIEGCKIATCARRPSDLVFIIAS